MDSFVVGNKEPIVIVRDERPIGQTGRDQQSTFEQLKFPLDSNTFGWTMLGMGKDHRLMAVDGAGLSMEIRGWSIFIHRFLCSVERQIQRGVFHNVRRAVPRSVEHGACTCRTPTLNGRSECSPWSLMGSSSVSKTSRRSPLVHGGAEVIKTTHNPCRRSDPQQGAMPSSTGRNRAGGRTRFSRLRKHQMPFGSSADAARGSQPLLSSAEGFSPQTGRLFFC